MQVVDEDPTWQGYLVYATLENTTSHIKDDWYRWGDRAVHIGQNEVGECAGRDGEIKRKGPQRRLIRDDVRHRGAAQGEIDPQRIAGGYAVHRDAAHAREGIAFGGVRNWHGAVAKLDREHRGTRGGKREEQRAGEQRGEDVGDSSGHGYLPPRRGG